MKSRTLVLSMLMVVFATVPAVAEEIYKRTDRSGNVVFSDTPPPPGVKGEIRELREDGAERPKAEERFRQPGDEGIREARPYAGISVIMYMTAWCPYCDKARTYLRSLNVHRNFLR